MEVLLSLALLALLTTSVMAVFTPPALWIKQAGNETAASNYADAIIEELRDERSKIQGTGNFLPEELNLSPEYKPERPADLEARIDIELMNGYGSLYKVKVSVNWMEGTALRDLSLVTAMRKY